MNKKLVEFLVAIVLMGTVVLPVMGLGYGSNIAKDDHARNTGNKLTEYKEVDRCPILDSIPPVEYEIRLPFTSSTPNNAGWFYDPYEIYEGQRLVITITGYWQPPQPERLICLWVKSDTLPEGATFTPECHCDYGEVSSVFDWTPAIGQAGTYVVVFYLGETCGIPLGTFSITIIVYPADLEPPVVVIELPPDGSTFPEPGDVTLTGYITDDTGIVSIGSHHVWDGGETWDSGTISPPYTYYPFEWVFPLYDGTNTITIYAYDSAEHYGDDTVSYQVATCSIDLTIYDGLEGTGGGNVVSEAKEVTRGAFTVTNIQDTNGDNIMDKNQNPVSATAKGRNEVDLMKMVLHPPEGPNCGPNSIVYLVKSGPNAGEVKLWDTNIKTNEIPPTNPPNTWTYKVSELPKTVWVEIREENPANLVMRGITFTYSTNCCPETDVVKATGIWARVTEVKHDNSDAWNAAVWPDMPAHVRAYLDDTNGFGLRRYSDGGRWWHANAIGLEFTVYPSGIGNEEGVSFDVSRQIHYLDIRVPGGVSQEQWPNQVEQPNDDTHNDDESEKPVNNHMYSIDTPGFTEDGWVNNILWEDSSNNFMEFMRVNLNGVKPLGETVQGSRCSPYYTWHAALWLSRDWTTPGNVTRRLVGAGGAEWHPINCVEPGHILLLDLKPPWNIP